MSGNLDSHQISKDNFLDGRIFVYQPIKGYRANMDSVLLASSIEASSDQMVLELGCGVGTVSMCLMARVSGLKVVCVEIQKRYVELAERNFEENGLKARVIHCCISDIPESYKALSFNQVILNPPYFTERSTNKIINHEKDLSKRELSVGLADWLNIALKRCASKGKITMIHKPDRLSQILRILDKKVGGISILPIISRKGNEAKRVLIRGEKGSSAPLKLLSPFYVHSDSMPNESNNHFTQEASSVLRDGKALSWSQKK